MKSGFTLAANYQVRGAAILFSYLHLGFFLIIAAYLGSARIGLHLRNARSWNEIVNRLRADAGAQSADIAAEMDRRFTNQTIEQRVGSVRGRRLLFRAAGVMIEMADYAERNGGVTIRPAAANLRGHAMAVRIATAKDIVRPSIQRRAK